MWIRLAKHGLPACVSSPLVAYRVHSSNSSLDIAELVRGTRRIEALHRTSADWGLLHRWMAESCLRRGHRAAAVGEFARAAVRGQAAAVAGDLYDILRRRFVRSRGAGQVEGGDPANAWVAEALEWLVPLTDSRPGTAAPAP